MMQVRPGEDFVVLLSEAPTGQVGTLEVGLIDAGDDTFVIASDTAGITEIDASGTYKKVFVAPLAEGQYLDIWTDGVTTVGGDELIHVTFSAVMVTPDLEDSYATVGQLDAYLEDSLPAGYDNDYLEKVLAKASDDIDKFSTGYVTTTSRLKFAESLDPIVWLESVEPDQSAWIVEATCAQAEWRLAKGDQYFVERPSNLGPKTKHALSRTGLYMTARFATAR